MFKKRRLRETEMVEANLLVTFEPTHADSAKKEIESLLSEVKEKAKILKADEGLAEISVKDAKKAVKALNVMAKKNKERFSHTFHWIPVEKWCKATIPEMQKAIKELQKNISAKEKWKMDIGRRKTDLHEKELILKLTEVIDKTNVDLKNPDKIFKVEIIGNKAGISVLDKEELLNTAKLK